MPPLIFADLCKKAAAKITPLIFPIFWSYKFLDLSCQYMFNQLCKKKWGTDTPKWIFHREGGFPVSHESREKIYFHWKTDSGFFVGGWGGGLIGLVWGWTFEFEFTKLSNPALVQSFKLLRTPSVLLLKHWNSLARILAGINRSKILQSWDSSDMMWHKTMNFWEQK